MPPPRDPFLPAFAPLSLTPGILPSPLLKEGPEEEDGGAEREQRELEADVSAEESGEEPHARDNEPGQLQRARGRVHAGY